MAACTHTNTQTKAASLYAPYTHTYVRVSVCVNVAHEIIENLLTSGAICLVQVFVAR